MKTSLDCVSCFVRQALDVARFVSDDAVVHEGMVRDICGAIARMDLGQTPPAMGQYIHRLVRERSGCSDPYAGIKHEFNMMAEQLAVELGERIAASEDRFDAAVRLAIAGNIIDFGVSSDCDKAKVLDTIDYAMTAEMMGGSSAILSEAVRGAERILYLGDNAGEIVFDRLLLEQMPGEKVTYAVRGGAVINDVTREDAANVGIDRLVRVIDNGDDAPGTILSQVSGEFRGVFDAADLIISKGQGNYETLSDVEAPIVFLLKAKCPVVAEHLSVPLGSLVLKASSCVCGVCEQQ